MTLDVDLETALASAAVPVAAAGRTVTHPEFYLDVVVKSGLDVSIADAITAGDLERTMDGASTLSLTLFDANRALLRNPDLARAIDLNFGGYWWRLVKVAKSGDDLTLTFEDRDVAYLRQHSKARKSYRGTVTRAQFVRQLVREVGQRGEKGRSKNRPVGQRPITFVCPELRKVQPVAAAPRDEGDRDTNREAGLNSRANLKVKGARATVKQRRNGQRVLDVADRLGAGPKATLALMEAVIIESQIQNLTHGTSDSIGILQVRIGIHGRAVASSIEKSVEKFLKTGFTSGKGAMELARETNASAAEVAQAVQGSGVPGAYATVADEARAWVDAYGGASGTDTGGSSRTDSARSRKRYEFRRGEPGQPEDSWTAIQRLAEEVHWHAFMDRGRLYYVSDDWLMRQKPRFILEEDDDGVQSIDFDVDQGKVSAEITVQARAEVFKVPVGTVVQIRKCGIADGRYLVARVHQGVFDHACEITLRAATPKLPEPPSEPKEQSSTSSGGASASAADIASGSPKHIIDSVVCPLARKHNMTTGTTPAMVSAANARHGATVDGNRSDHQGPPGLAWAADMSNGSSPTPQMDALARDLAQTFGISWQGSGLVNGGKSGYRYQLIYRTNEGGNHYNHVHLGVHKT